MPNMRSIAFLPATLSDDRHRLMQRMVRSEVLLVPDVILFERDCVNNAEQQLHDLQEAIKFGIDGLVIEPVNLALLLETINTLADKGVSITTVAVPPNSRLRPTIQQLGIANLEYPGDDRQTVDTRFGEQARLALRWMLSRGTSAEESKERKRAAAHPLPTIPVYRNEANNAQVPQPSPALVSRLPIALLPVRLETRFVDNEDGETELLIRIYPDDVFVDAHEPLLTEEEYDAGVQYWTASWARGVQDEAGQEALWAMLVERFGATRAAWIVHALIPANLSERPQTSEAANHHPCPTLLDKESAPFRERSWTRAAHTELLPDVWEVRAYTEGMALLFKQRSALLPDRLPMGLSPEDNFTVTDEVLEAGQDIRWRMDFEAAELLGMGIRINLSRPPQGEVGSSNETNDIPKKIDRLIVIGLKESIGNDGREGKARLERLLNAHQYTWGFGFVPQGTPTNNTNQAASGHSERDPGAAQSYQAAIRDLHREPRSASVDKATGRLTASYLGLVPEQFDRVPNAELTEQVDARAMRTALWPATWEAYITTSLSPSYDFYNFYGLYSDQPANPLPSKVLKFVHKHFIDFVQARGPLPAWKIDQQPYGVLPVTLLDQWTVPAYIWENEQWPVSPEEVTKFYRALKRILLDLRSIGRVHLPFVPRIPDPAGDPDAALVEALTMDAVSSSFDVRNVIPTTPASAVINASGQMVDRQERREQARSLLRLLGYPDLESALLDILFDDSATPLTEPLVQADITRDTPRLAENPMNFIEEILTQNWNSLDPPKSLLDKLLRTSAFSFLQIIKYQVMMINYGDDTMPTGYKNMDGIDLRRLVLGIDDLAYEHKVEELSEVRAEAQKFVDAFERLRTLRPWNLERLLKETLDLSSHRLDAWITSLADMRLRTQRRNDPIYSSGIHIGAYGWVENLERKGVLTRTPNTMNGQPVYTDSENEGFIHAPSDTHAAAAAVLYNGYLTHQEDKEVSDVQRSALALDLSPERVRDAVWLMEGIRDGLSLGALLGYRFEHMLQESDGLAKYLDLFRRAAPLRLGKVVALDVLPSDTLVKADAVDGVALLNLRDTNTIPWSEWNIEGHERESIGRMMSRLDAIMDAGKDTMLAESVFQIVQGNMMRSGASLDTLARGDVPPPPLDVAKSARSGIGIVHQLLLLLHAETQAPISPRAQGEPKLDAWAADLFGSRIVCHVEYLNREDQPIQPPIEVALDQLGLSPLDIVYLATIPDPSQVSELEIFINAVLQLPPWRPELPSEEIHIRLLSNVGTGPNQLSLNAALAIAQAARVLLYEGGVRALTTDDLLLPSTSPAANASALLQRAQAAQNALEDACDALHSLVDHWSQARTQGQDISSEAIDAISETLLALALFGIPGAVPQTRDVSILLNQAKEVLIEGDKRSRVQDETNIPDPATHLKTIFGDDFLVLLSFDLPSEWFSRSEELLQGSQLAIEDWFQRISRVRPGAGRLHQLVTIAEAMDKIHPLFKVEQWPYPEATAPAERWVGLPLNGTILNGSRRSLVALMHRDVLTAPTGHPHPNISGLIIDAWNEVIPNSQEVTSVAFQYNAPNNASPQSILLAVHPNGYRDWDYEMVASIVLETLELAKLRLLDPESWGLIGHFAPALHIDNP